MTNRGEVRCLDTEGFLDGENDGPFNDEKTETNQEADVIWTFDMMKELGVSQHNMAVARSPAPATCCSCARRNGVDEEHKYIPAPDAPSFIAMDKNTGKVLWTDNSPGLNILHGQWSSPAYAVLGGQPQVIFGGGDGWLYSFDPKGDGDGKSKLLWKFDCNPKDAKLELMGKGTRNDFIGTPVVYDGLVYVAAGEDPEHGEGVGHLWCIDPTKKLDGSDVSPELAFNAADPRSRFPTSGCRPVEAGRRFRPAEPELGRGLALQRSGSQRRRRDRLRRNDAPHARQRRDQRRHSVHRRLQRAVPLPRRQGTENRESALDVRHALGLWGSPLIVDDKVYIGDEDGDVAIFRHSADPNVAMKEEDGEMEPFYGTQSMGTSVYSTPRSRGMCSTSRTARICLRSRRTGSSLDI